MENKETTAFIKSIQDKKTAVGVLYWVIETDKGNLSSFDDKLVAGLKPFIGKSVSISYQLTDKGFMNLKKVMGEASKVIPEVEVKDSLDTIEVALAKSSLEARKAKDTSIYTSYAKDMFIAIYDPTNSISPEVLMMDCVNLIKQARDAFK